jgi:hypothetical protein
MARENEGAASMVRPHERRRRRCSAGMVREEERSCGPHGPKGRTCWLVAGPNFEGKFFLE